MYRLQSVSRPMAEVDDGENGDDGGGPVIFIFIFSPSSLHLSSLLLLALAVRSVGLGGSFGGGHGNQVLVGDIADALVLLGAAVALLVKAVLLGEDAPLAFAKGAIVLGLEA